MSKFGKKSKEEIHKMSVDDFCKYMEEWEKATDEKWHMQKITESEMPHFKTIDEARKYYGGISFDDFEQKYFEQKFLKV